MISQLGPLSRTPSSKDPHDPHSRTQAEGDSKSEVHFVKAGKKTWSLLL